MIKLGDRVKDCVSGVEGIVFGRTEFLVGETEIGIYPDDKENEGQFRNVVWIAEERCIATSVTQLQELKYGG